MTRVEPAAIRQLDLLVEIAAAGFYDDPVMTWVFPDPATRLAGLRSAFVGLVRDFLPDRGLSHLVDDACVTFWRGPTFDYDAPHEGSGETSGAPMTPEVVGRFLVLDGMMRAAHPHDTPHWYLNVIGTRPERQGQGLGTQALAPVLATCDADGVPAYLESSNPRNMTLYRRHGFEQTGELTLPDGPTLYPMWREPRR